MRNGIDIVPGAIDRPRVAAMLAERWHRRVVTMVAGAGFGKTTALAQTVRDAAGPGRVDHLVVTDASCSTESELVRRVAGAMGLAANGLTDLLRGLSELTGEHCLLVDDVHEIAPQSGGEGALRQLVDELPPGVHAVIASRRPLALRLARARAAGQVLDIGESELAYSPDEVATIADRSGVARSVLDAAAGWPALVALTATAGRHGAIEFLAEEVLDRLDPKASDVLAIAVLAGTAEPELVRTIAGTEVDARAIAAAVPLVAVDPAGALTPHDLWTEPVEHRMLPAERHDLLRRIGAYRRGRGEHRLALQAATRAGDASAFAEVVRDIGQLGHIALNIDEIDHWLESAPDTFAATAEGRLLAAISARAVDQFSDATRDLLRASWRELRELGEVGCEVVAMSELAFVHRARGEPAEMLPVIARLLELEAAGHDECRPLATFARAAIAEQLGDVDGALATLDDLHRGDLSDGWMALVEFQRCNHLLLLGRPREALAAARRSAELGSPGYLGGWCAERSARWHLGVTREVLDQLPIADELDGASLVDRIWIGSWFGAMQAFAGQLDAATRNVATARASLRADSQPELVGFVTWAEAALAVADHDPERGRETLERFLADHPLTSTHGRRLAARAPSLFALLLGEDARRHLDDVLAGRWQREMLGVADLLVDLRGGRPVGRWPEPAIIMCALPLPWAVEMAARGAALGHPDAEPLTDHLRDVCGPATFTRELDLLTDAGARPPALGTPDRSTRPEVRLLGRVRVEADGLRGVDELRRKRVRELLALIALAGPISREALAEHLWPGLATDRSSHNLRVNLTYLGRIRDRTGGRVAVEGARGWELADGVTSDAARFERLVADADAAARAGAPSSAIGLYDEALRLVAGSPLCDACDEVWLGHEAARLGQRIGAAAMRAARLAERLGDHGATVHFATVALDHDPYHEEAWRLLVTGRRHAGDVDGAGDAAETALRRLTELGVDPEEATLAAIAAARGDDRRQRRLAPG